MPDFKFEIGEVVDTPNGKGKILLRFEAFPHNSYRVVPSVPSVLGGTIKNYNEDQLVKRAKLL